MGYKIFISYKYSDHSVEKLNHSIQTTARDYVDEIQQRLSNEDHMNKGENDNESLDDFKDTTIETKLKGKIFDSSITIVLISKNMWDKLRPEQDQWIPWEISYSLREKTRNNITSHPNGMLAVTIPDEYGDYNYFIDNHYCESCSTTLYKTDNLFKILRDNMFNEKIPTISNCSSGNHKIYTGEFSYIKVVKWIDFLNNMNRYLDKVIEIKANRENYKLSVNPY